MVNLYYLYKEVKEVLGSELESREICAFSCKVDRNTVFNWKNIEINNEEVAKTYENVEKRKNGVPLAYIIGEWEFYSLTFKVNENVLIPRADTETLVDEVILYTQKSAKILDICTGSGAIAIALAKNLKDAKVVAIDISKKALDVAKENAKLNDVNVDFSIENALKGMENDEKYDVIVSNPPYIPSEDIKTLDKDVKDYEPILALDGDADGLKFYRAICEKFKKNLKENGKIYFEYGINQEEDVKNILKENGFENIEIKKDLCGVHRIAKAALIGG